jgi:hypothetical protein
MRRLDGDEPQFAVYLLDPGPRGSGVITLLQEVTGASTGNCAQMVRTSPTYVTAYTARSTAEDLVARFKEFDAIAVVRPVGKPLREGPSPDIAAAQSPPVVPILLFVLAIAQLGVSLLWMHDGRLISAVVGVVLAIVAMIASWLMLRRG